RMLRLLGVFLIGLIVADSYKILVYSPKFGHSHSNFMGRIADIMAEAGHDVSTIVNVIDHEVADGTKLSKIIKIQPSEETTNMYGEMTKTKADMFEMNNFNPIGAYFMGKFFGAVFASQCRALLDEPGLVQKLKEEKFDIFFTEHFDMCGVGLVELIKPRSLISVAASVPFGPQLEEFGIPKALSYDPALYVSKMNVHSIYDRIINILGDFVVRLSFDQMRTSIIALYREKYGPNFPSLEEISSNSAYVFANTEPLIDYAVPTISKVVAIGGIGAKEPNKLSEDWVKILSKREKTVLLSFGSVAKSAYLPIKVKMSIVETVKALPDVTFIWKYEVDDDFTRDHASKLKNLELTKWMPQVDLLAHPNLSLFITHGGMGSTQETALRGVPGIFIPIFGDQPRNAGMMEHNKFGKVLDKTEVTNSAKFVSVIREVLEDDSYRANAKRVSAMLHKRPFTAKEQLIKYTEFAAEFGPSKALRPQSHDMNWIEYHNVDIIVTGIVFTIISAVITLKIVQRVLSRFIGFSKAKKD
ncbi:ugt-22, partial [Pristionchus pacificus]